MNKTTGNIAFSEIVVGAPSRPNLARCVLNGVAVRLLRVSKGIMEIIQKTIKLLVFELILPEVRAAQLLLVELQVPRGVQKC